MRIVLFLVCVTSLGLVSGCDTTTTSPQAEVVVEGYLQANAPLDSVYLTRVVAADATFNPRNVGVSGATVQLTEVDADGRTVRTIAYDEARPGAYAPTNARGTRVQPRHTYRLAVDVPGDDRITATTTVPDPIRVVDAQNTQAVYQGPVQPALTVTRSAVDGRQNVFVFTTTSQLDFSQPDDVLREHLTPFYADAIEDDEDLRDFRVTSSGLLNEGNFTINPEGTITIDLPWLAVAFYGPNVAAISAVDDNLFDFLRTQEAQQGGLAPGEIPNVRDPIEGGTGIFGSYARATQPVQILRPEAP